MVERQSAGDSGNRGTTASSERALGIDVSRWQEQMDWEVTADAGVAFAFIRSTIGAAGLDPRFEENWAGAEAAGLLRGPYHLYRPDRDAIIQAEHFAAHSAGSGDLPPAVDLERIPGVEPGPSYPDEVRRFLTHLRNLTGRRPIIYTNTGFWNNVLGAPNWGAGYDLWLAQWTAAEEPAEVEPWGDDWTFWQYSNQGDGPAYGSTAERVDLNRFDGDEAALRAYAANSQTPGGGELLRPATVAKVAAKGDSGQVQAGERRSPLFDGFDSPVGTDAERASANIWPGRWIDVNPFLNPYEIRPGVYHIHTGADLNLNYPTWDGDRFKPVLAAGNGQVTFAGDLGGSWGNVVVIKHRLADGQAVYSRYGHLDSIAVSAGDQITRGQQLGVVGRPPPDGAYHLHFDIATSHILEDRPGHWPGSDAQAVADNYADPRRFIVDHRPELSAGPEPPAEKVDLLPYFTGGISGYGLPFEMQSSWGSQERFQLQVEGERFYYVTGDPDAANWQERWYEPGEQMVYFGTDTTQSAERTYTQRRNGRYGAPWCPRALAVAEFAGPLATQVALYRQSDCEQIGEGRNIEYRQLAAQYAEYTFPSGVTLYGVIELASYTDPNGHWLEKSWFSRDHRAPGLVGWLAADGRRFWVSELYTPGSQRDSRRLVIPCLGLI